MESEDEDQEWVEEDFMEQVEDFWTYVEDYNTLLIEDGDGSWEEEYLNADEIDPRLVEFDLYMFPQYSDVNREIDCIELAVPTTDFIEDCLDQLVEAGSGSWPEL